MTSLARITETRAHNETRRHGRNVSAHERATIVAMLRDKPLPVVRAAFGRSLSTLLRIADVAGKNGEL